MTTNRMGLEQEGRLGDERLQQVIDGDILFTDEQREMARELLAYRVASGEPAAWIVHARGGDQLTIDGDYVANAEGMGSIHSTPLFAAPPIQAVTVPDAIEPDYDVIKRILPTSNPDEYACCIAADMWNACRAAMLKSVTNEP